MDAVDLNQRLSRISTQWTRVFAAHRGDGAEARAALSALMQRYSGAVYRYLLKSVGNADAAEELAQTFALKFLEGRFQGATPERGRFRNYLKTALIHLIADYHNERAAAPRIMDSQSPEPAAPADDDSAADFLSGWRDELLERTWAALHGYNALYHAALKLRIADPDLPSSRMAEQLTATLGKPVNAALARKAVQRAHDKFADLLLDEVSTSLTAPTPADLAAELQELDLLKYCRAALQRRQGSS